MFVWPQEGKGSGRRARWQSRAKWIYTTAFAVAFRIVGLVQLAASATDKHMLWMAGVVREQMAGEQVELMRATLAV